MLNNVMHIHQHKTQMAEHKTAWLRNRMKQRQWAYICFGNKDKLIRFKGALMQLSRYQKSQRLHHTDTVPRTENRARLASLAILYLSGKRICTSTISQVRSCMCVFLCFFVHATLYCCFATVRCERSCCRWCTEKNVPGCECAASTFT